MLRAGRSEEGLKGALEKSFLQMSLSLCLHMPVSEPFFPRTSPWKRALAGTLPVLVLLLIGMSYFGWREHKAKEREVMERKKESQEKEEMSSNKEGALAAKGKSGQQVKSEVPDTGCAGRMGNKSLPKNCK